MKDFFEKIGFTFGTQNAHIKPNEITISENNALTQKLKGNVYVFDSPSPFQDYTHTSFYVITIPLSKKDFFELRRYIWNENEYDLYFLAEKPESKFITTLYYAKTDPREPELKIKSFKGAEEDTEELETIKKWKFDSGAFWMSYIDFLNKIKKKQQEVDYKLIHQLKELKKKLHQELKEIENPTQIVQALIDRTLFIKFLEDNHIINSYFYQHHFPDKFKTDDIEFDYKILLKDHDIKNINKLFAEINQIFNNILFETPKIKKEYLTDNVLDLICQAIEQEDWESRQLSLFDFRFDVIPIEFISHIYEVFLEDNQLDEGIYYTPTKLAHLIIDDTITQTGTVLDPACGSGMFLILAFRKLLENNPLQSNDVYEKIKHKNKLLKTYIYGIEKENTAWRLAVFSLYLEILKDIPAQKIKAFIKQELENKSDLKIFPYDFSTNIINHNTLEVEEDKIPHNRKTFDYIVGNPPFLQIKPEAEEKAFIDNYFIETNEKTIKANEVIGYNQISQAFMLKIKDWTKLETRFGFVLNSSNFYNEKSKRFQEFFFQYYQLENFYELSSVKDILFRKAKENVVVVIFNNKKVTNNLINYYPVDMGIFSKIFDLLIIQEDKKIKISQENILDDKTTIRDYLLANEYDLKLISEINNKTINFDKFINGLAVGLRITGSDKISAVDKSYNALSKKEQRDKLKKVKSKFISPIINDIFTLPYIEYRDIEAFRVNINKYLSKDDFINKRYRNNKDLLFFKGKKILLRKIPRKPRKESKFIYEAIFDENILCFPDGVFCIRLNDEKYFHLMTALLNSTLINYYIHLIFLKRTNSSNPHIGEYAIKNIPIPKILDEDLVIEISELSQKLTEGKLIYEGETKEKLNDLIFDLYDLGYLARERIRNYFTDKKNVENEDLDNYKEALHHTLEMYFENKPIIEYYQNPNLGFEMVVTVLYFNNSYKEMPSSEKKFRYIINRLLQDSNEKFLAMREKIIGTDCIYIVKDNQYKNWSTSKAFEDGREILRLLGL